MKFLSLAKPSLKRVCLGIASLFLLFFIGCTVADDATTSLTPVREAQQLLTAIQANNAFTATFDTTGANPVIVLTATNMIDAALSFTVDITQEEGVLTTDPANFTVTATDVISPHEEIISVMATFGTAEARPYTVKAIINGALIADWFTTANIDSYIATTFAGQMATLSLDDANLLSVMGLMNAMNGAEGSIRFTLPRGFTVSPSSIALPDPDAEGIDAGTITPSETSFTISEDGRAANSESYTINTISIEAFGDELQQLADLIQTSNPNALFSVSVDKSDANAPVIVLTATDANTVASASSFTVAINQGSGITTSPDMFSVRATDVISPHEETISLSATFGTATAKSYTVKAIINGAPIGQWLTASTVSQYITTTFAGQMGTLSLDDANMLSVMGLMNAMNGADGSISFTLPRGFTVSPSSIALPDPDAEGIDAGTITPSETSFTISEDGMPANSESYTINPINLEVFGDELQQLANLIQTSNPNALFSVSVDESDANAPIIFLTATNTASSALALTVNINQGSGITTSPDMFSVTATDVISPHEETISLSATFGAATAKSFTVKTVINGAPIETWLTASTVSQYITATFAGQVATLSLDDATKTLSITGLMNAMNGADGSIAMANLPTGFSAAPSSITLSDPDADGIAAAVITLSETSFTISEDDMPANSQAYTINTISLDELRRFVAGIHIRVSDGTTDISDTLSMVEANGVITITGLTNSLGMNKSYTLTISPVTDTFSTPNNTSISITITEPAGFSGGDATLSLASFTVTNQGDSTGTPYTLQVPFRGASIADWLTSVDFNTYFTGASFGGQTATLSFDGSEVSMSGGLTNLPSGAIVLTSQNIPTGYTLIGADALTDPDGDRVAEIMNGDAGSITITEDAYPANTATYPVKISLAAYVSPVMTNHIAVTDFGGNAIGQGSIDITDTVITISDLFNIDGAAGTISVTITPPTTGDTYTITPSGLFTFNNPAGTDAAMETNTVNVTNSGGFVVEHRIVVDLLGPLSITITDTNLSGGSATISSGGTITMTAACEFLASMPTSVTISSGPAGSMLQTPVPAYYDRAVDKLSADMSKYTVTKTLTITNANGAVVDDAFMISLEFPVCNVTSSSFGSGTGTDASSAYQIDSPAKLELLSYLVETDSDYRNKFYELTANIVDMAGMGFNFTPIGKETAIFSGTFDCSNNTISNLYINRAGTDNVSLFGYVSGATIQNCALSNVNVTGNTNVGGLVGLNSNNSTVTNSYATGSIAGASYVGGLVGFNNDNSTVTNSYATGSVTGTDYGIGGLVGASLSSSIVENSYATGSVSGIENGQAGGLVGLNNSSTVKNSYATGSVIGINIIGGLVGLNNNSTVTNSYSTGSVTGTAINVLTVGGLIGTDSSSTVENSYWDSETSGYTTTGTFGAGTPRTTAQMQVAAPVATGNNKVYESWGTALWSYSASRYPLLINVRCANRQLNPDAADCTALP